MLRTVRPEIEVGLMFVYTIGDVIALLVYGTIALIAIIVFMADKKDKDPADSITVKSMFGRLFAVPVKNRKIIGMTPDGGDIIQGSCPRCGIALDSTYKRCPKCWQKLRWK